MYSIVIATYNRKEELAIVIDCLNRQSFKPNKIIIVDSSEEIESYFSDTIPITYKHVDYKSAAKQRNEGALICDSEYIVFLDDDVEFGASFFEQIFNLVRKNEIIICGPRQIGAEIKIPSKLLGTYYRIQAGFPHPNYGGKLFGAGINCYPYYNSKLNQDIIEVDWLPATCLIIKNDIFQKHWFPNFEGYSFAEDVYLTASIGKFHKIYNFPNIAYLHHSVTTPFKQDLLAINKMKLQNQRKIAKEILGLKGGELRIKFFLHKLFLSLSALKNQKKKLQYLCSIWQ